VLEASEVLEHFQWRDESADPEALAGELADVALYLLQLASISGIDLEQAILDKLALNGSGNGPIHENFGRQRSGTRLHLPAKCQGSFILTLT
jgi:hypothetical protein